VHTWISSPGSEIKRFFYTLNGKSYTTTINPQANDLLISHCYDFLNVQVILGSNPDNLLGGTYESDGVFYLAYKLYNKTRKIL
jgi:hypothetical protein